MKAGFLYLTKRDLEEMTPKQVNLLIEELNRKTEKGSPNEDLPLPSKEEFEKEVEELVKQGKLDKKFLTGMTGMKETKEK